VVTKRERERERERILADARDVYRIDATRGASSRRAKQRYRSEERSILQIANYRERTPPPPLDARRRMKLPIPSSPPPLSLSTWEIRRTRRAWQRGTALLLVADRDSFASVRQRINVIPGCRRFRLPDPTGRIKAREIREASALYPGRRRSALRTVADPDGLSSRRLIPASWRIKVRGSVGRRIGRRVLSLSLSLPLRLSPNASL